jgi:AraC-like DNA-binding protein
VRVSRARGGVGVRDVRPSTLNERRRIYLLARVLIARHYRRALTVGTVARALSCSPRQLQRVYAQFGELTFQEDLLARRMAAAAELLARQPIPVCDVARLVGYRHRSHFARVFAARYGISPARFRERERAAQRAAKRELAEAGAVGVGSPDGGAPVVDASCNVSARGR